MVKIPSFQQPLDSKDTRRKSRDRRGEKLNQDIDEDEDEKNNLNTTYDKGGLNREGSNADKNPTEGGMSPGGKRKRKIYRETAFKGYGLMKFDDYNYSSLNKVVFEMPKIAASALGEGEGLLKEGVIGVDDDEEAQARRANY